jgi:hypothetical protein
MISPETLLLNHGVRLRSYGPGRHYTTCPKCSRDRKTAAHRGAEILGVTIGADDSVHFGCNHCGWTGPEKGKNGADGSPLTAYSYRDKSGALQFRKIRNPPGWTQRFWLQKWDRASASWTKGTEGVDTSILYRAAEVSQAIEDGRVIAVVEGEKDTDRLWSIGIAATCNAHGASEPGKKPKWTKRHSKQLAGADIVVLNDNDAAGYAHAQATCELSLGVAKRVRRLDLRAHCEMPEGGDVSDWLEQGHTPAELEALIADAPGFVPAPESHEEPSPTSDDALALSFAEAQAGRLRYVAKWGKWFRWTGKAATSPIGSSKATRLQNSKR